MNTQDVERQLNAHQGLEFKTKDIISTFVAVVFENEPKVLKYMLLGKKSSPLYGKITSAKLSANNEKTYWLTLQVQGSITVSSRVIRIDEDTWRLAEVVTPTASSSAGRPIGTGEDRAITFRLRLTEAERERLDDLAAEAGMTASQYVRSKIF